MWINSWIFRLVMVSPISTNVLLVKIEGPVWYTIYHHLPVVQGVSSNPSINQPTNGKRTPMDQTCWFTSNMLIYQQQSYSKISQQCGLIHINLSVSMSGNLHFLFEKIHQSQVYWLGSLEEFWNRLDVLKQINRVDHWEDHVLKIYCFSCNAYIYIHTNLLWLY